MIPKLEEMLTWFNGNVMNRPGNPVGLSTNEGPAAINELIEFLKVQQPLPALEWQEEMQQASRDHVLDTGPSGMTGHTGTDGS